MRQFHFRYEQRLTLDRPVRDHHFRISCRPMENGRQHCGEYRMEAEPADVCREVTDGFGNRAYAGAVMAPHQSLTVTAEGRVAVDLSGPGEPFHPMYRYPSAFTQPDEELRRFFKETGAEDGHRTPGEKCMLIMNRLYGRFVYVPGATTVRTTAAEAFSRGQGVCQDYAHIFICLCRLAGIPARYAAGMVPGVGETHAWAEVWLDGGWVGFDPANNRLAGESCIKLTHGRDFMDSAVDRGRFLGFAAQKQEILVKVEEIL